MILIQINYSDTGIGIAIPKFLYIPISSFDFLKNHDFFLTLTMGCCSLNKQAQTTYIQTIFSNQTYSFTEKSKQKLLWQNCRRERCASPTAQLKFKTGA